MMADQNRLAWNLRKNYGLTVEEYEALLDEQGGLCAICQRPERAQRAGRTMRLPVDHDHTTGRIRGLLCHSCNRAIGLLQDDPALLVRAADYLLRQHAPAGS